MPANTSNCEFHNHKYESVAPPPTTPCWKGRKNTNLDRTGYNGVNTSDASSTAGEPWDICFSASCISYEISKTTVRELVTSVRWSLSKLFAQENWANSWMFLLQKCAMVPVKSFHSLLSAIQLLHTYILYRDSLQQDFQSQCYDIGLKNLVMDKLKFP